MIYKRAANHWKRPPRFERRETEQEEEESEALRKTGTPRSLKEITRPREGGRHLGSELPNGAGPDRTASGAGQARGTKGYST